ncbi:MAG: AraC family transcriptional regulator [Treponema sp.]|nr:AraC family transcriptional regulator [Treponema sp.]
METLPFHEEEQFDLSFPFRAWDSYKAPFWFPLHWHEPLELLYILKGKLNFSLDGKSRECRQGDIIVIDSGLVHGFFDPQPETLARIFQFGRSLVDEALNGLRDNQIFTAQDRPIFKRKAVISGSLDPGLYSGIENLLAEIFSENEKKLPGYKLAVKSGLYELTLKLLRGIPHEISPVLKTSAGAGAEKNGTQYLERIFSFLLNHYNRPQLSLDDAAAEAGLSRFYLSRFLKEKTGQGFHDHLTLLRMRNAEKYLTGSDIPIIEVAFLSGFQSLATFNRIFKSQTGLTPSAFRRARTGQP